MEESRGVLDCPSVAPSSVVSRWYEALFWENCMEVMQLLKNHPGLLEVGWKPEPSRMFTGRRSMKERDTDRTNTKACAWKGRTAFHVAARRGCATLVKQIIILLLNLNGDDGFRRWDEEVTQVLRQRELLIKLADPLSALEGNNPRPFRLPHVSDGDEPQRVLRVFPCRRFSDTNEELTTVSPEPSDPGKSERGRSSKKASAGPSDSSHKELLRASEGDRREVPTDVIDTATGSSRDDLVVSGGNPTELNRNANDSVTSSQDDELVSDGDTYEVPQIPAETTRQNESDDADVRWMYGPSLSPRNSRYFLLVGTNPFTKLLDCRDGEYMLDAVAMAYLHRNLEILSLFNVMSTRDSRGDLKMGFTSVRTEFDAKLHKSSQLRGRLRKTTENWWMNDTLNERDPRRNRLKFLLKAYVNDQDFNFLPWGEYLFHCLHQLSKGGRFLRETALARSLWRAVRSERGEDSSSDSTRPQLWKFLLQLQDGQGRTPFDVAVDAGTIPILKFSLSSRDEQVMTTADASGMAAWHRAAALGPGFHRVSRFREIMKDVFRFDWSLDDENVVRCVDIESIVTNVDRLSKQNGFKGHRIVEGKFVEFNAPIHSTIILHNARTLDRICSVKSIYSDNDSDNDSDKNFDINSVAIFSKGDIEFMRSFLNPKSRFTCWFNNRPCAFNPLDLATLLGDLSKVKRLLRLCSRAFRDEWTYKDDRQPSTKVAYGPRAIHLAAHHGSYKMLKEILDNPMAACDPYAEDQDGNTALHYAMKMLPVKFEPHLCDYVSCEHLRENDLRERDEIIYPIVERQGCINRLLQTGCDVFRANRDGQIPYPSSDLSTNAGFLQWWYEKQSREFAEIQNTMSFATNAISVTAALVATASYVGPLQPPLGYGDDHQIQAKNLWVKAFIVCDTLSFYLAIASITFSLIPSLPVPQQPMREELRRKRVMVLVATAILFPSIICILVAFASSSIAVTSANGPSSPGGSLTIFTSAIGALICLAGFLLFSIRLLKFIFPRSKWIRTMYDLTSF